MKKIKLLFIPLTALVIIGTSGFYLLHKNKSEPVQTNFEKNQTKQEPTKKEEKIIPASYSLTVPYSVQAPFANWNIHEESCEEAALAMYHDYLQNRKEDIPPAVADKRFREMKDWQVKNLGQEPDLSMEALGKLAKDYYGHNYQVLTTLTIEQIKTKIAAGKPVIVPVMTHSLKNPHYNVEDSYHVILIKGYDETGVTTNDPGIKQGKDWHYSWEIIFSAIDAQNIDSGRQGLVIF